MLGQIDLYGRDKVERSIERLKMFEPKDGYFLAFSGGKDSQCVYELAKMAGVKFEAHYHVTSVDPPELIYFIRKQYPDVIFDKPRFKDGRQITMWRLIEKNTIPPTRMARYCCDKLKESGGKGRVVITGVRWAESSNRRTNQGHITIQGANKKRNKMLEDIGADFMSTPRGGGGAQLRQRRNQKSRGVLLPNKQNACKPDN